MYPLLTRDPASGGELVVTRLHCPTSGVTIEGEFSLGWIGRLTPEQIDFVGLLLARRNNLQKLADDLGVAYNTARTRLDEIVAAIGGSPDTTLEEPEDPGAAEARRRILEQLAGGELSYDDALAALRSLRS
ncbi:MAG TPA: DUF2089 domain-containing protein [Actinomycetota bacterium]|nr:DUF2089 domain-containing protein [Actinomycetota bacterium]